MSYAIYLPEAELQVALRTATKLLPLVARQRKAKRGVMKSATVSDVVYLLATQVASNVANSCQTSAPRS
ncbi:hypothetical protein SAMN02745116_01863 [Pilibacter termitis]|uniref:Uncharacterized protein n=1 Tax=Pilibacter termitis TaxID=263852 RepID=A0A1T4PMY1_9ENTE|nr:hypothetical protein [Pilibacter termitis]SJZ92567.1 hypothetical protein SAMN02745116_01863 [Pilibacter termitis]